MHGTRPARRSMLATAISRWSSRATLLTAALMLTPAAFAAEAVDVEGFWDGFAKNCTAIAAADDPVTKAAGLFGPPASGSVTEDGAIAVGSITIDNPSDSSNVLFIITTAQRFEDGRSVQCMVQLLRPEPAWRRIAAVARERATTSFPEVTVVAGGPLKPTFISDDLPPDSEFKDVTFQRFTSDDFPPHAMVTVQVLPQVIILNYLVHQAGDD